MSDLKLSDATTTEITPSSAGSLVRMPRSWQEPRLKGLFMSWHLRCEHESPQQKIRSQAARNLRHDP